MLKSFCKTVVPALCLLLFLSSCDNGEKLGYLRPNDVIVAFGDSLTQGVGAPETMSYPAELRRLLGRRVINAGVSGETSLEGARRLPGVLDEHDPKLLVLCHGGNDILRKLDRQALRENLRRMIEAARQRRIDVVLIAVPQLGFGLSDVPLYRDVAQQQGLPLLEGTLAELLGDADMRSDAVHLNAQGYQTLASAVADLLKQSGALN